MKRLRRDQRRLARARANEVHAAALVPTLSAEPPEGYTAEQGAVFKTELRRLYERAVRDVDRVSAKLTASAA